MRFRLIILLIITITCISHSFAKGASGNYFISGKVYVFNNAIKSDQLLVDFYNHQWKVDIDSNGKFEIEIVWISACPSRITEKERNLINQRLNPKWITITYKGRTLKVKNQWKKYARLGYSDKKEVTRKLNLNFE